MCGSCSPLPGVLTVGLMYEPRVGNLSVLVGGERAEDTKLRLLASDIICDLSIDALPLLSVFSDWRGEWCLSNAHVYW